MGVVYRAQDTRLEREVAVKVLSERRAKDRSSRKRFRREARALSRLNHPNVLTMYDFDRAGDVEYLVTELVSGESLSQALQRGPLETESVLRLGVQLAKGLAAAHARGVVHRDISPANLHVTDDGTLKILDFGVAHWKQPVNTTEATQSIDREQSVSGTLAYMSPEQLRGRVEPSSDIYSAGAVLFQLVTGRRPFLQDQFTDLLDAILHQEPPSPRSLNPSISVELEEVILCALAKDPADRFAHADALAEALQGLLSDGTSSEIGGFAKERASRPGGGLRADLPGRARSRSGSPGPGFAGLGSGWSGSSKSRSRVLRWAGSVLALALAGVAGFATFAQWVPWLRSEVAAANEPTSVAILPLRDPDGSGARAEVLTDLLTSYFASVSTTRVVSRTTTEAYRDSGLDTRQLASKLGVGALVEGAIVPVGGKLLLTLRWIDAATDRVRWTRTLELGANEDVLRDLATSLSADLKTTVDLPLPLLPPSQS